MILRAKQEHLAQAAILAAELWPDNTPEELTAELEQLPPSECAVFLAVENGVPAGFAQCQLRHDYVEGTHSSPVGYLEGIYVRKDVRGRGLARALLSACEDWAREQGCLEFASDCAVDNGMSIAFHRSAGFDEANRIVCFTKELRSRCEQRGWSGARASAGPHCGPETSPSRSEAARREQAQRDNRGTAKQREL